MRAHPQLDSKTTAELKQALVAARDTLVRARGASEQELDAIEAEREIEYQELAQEEQTADVRTRLTQQQYAQLRQIDGALERIERGSYGLCADCGKPIAIDRLHAQPSAALCARHAAGQQHRNGDGRDVRPAERPQDHAGEVPDTRADDHLAGTPLPPELSSLDDAEIVATIRDAFQNEVGEALENVRILCRDGVVILAGEVPNEALPEIARRIVEDEVGYEVVDRMLVTEFAGGPGTPRKRVTPGGQLPTDTVEIEEDEGEISDDILQVEEQGLTFVPPSRPVPER